jgi:hypothetical protein
MTLGGGSSLYVLGAKQRKSVLKREEEWQLYESALILEIDPETGTARTRIEYKTPPEARANGHSSIMFKAGTLIGNRMYACTSTEVLVFELPAFKIVNYISLPCFNDLHHVIPDKDGNLIVASTGLDMVVKVTSNGDVLKAWDVLGDPLWSRFSRETDYRKVDSTKPHRSHPNFVFHLGEELWVTRFYQRDAISLSEPGKRVDIGIQSPHDGVVRGDNIFFTTVDGHIVIADRSSLKVHETIDLKQINGQTALLGWCRGLLALEENRAWVAFTRVRKTNLRENILWIRNIFRDGMTEKPTHLALYDLATRQCLQEIDLESCGMNVVFSVFPAVPVEMKHEDQAVSVTGALPHGQ